MHYFPSERARFFNLLTWVLFPGLLVFVTVIQILAPVPFWAWFFFVALPLGLAAALAIWIWVSTGYTVTETELIVRSGFLTWRTPLTAITRVRPTRNALSSAALSLDRLEVRTTRGLGPLISPQRRAEFLQLLRERCPQAQIEG